MGYVMRNDARRLRNYANKPIGLGWEPAFETAIPLGTSLCVKCMTVEDYFDKWHRPCRFVDGRDAVLLVAGLALCAECAVKSWEGGADGGEQERVPGVALLHQEAIPLHVSPGL